MGYKIKEIREKKQISQTELAQMSGISRATIWALENGTERTTTTRTLEKIAKALNTTIEELFFSDAV